ncbi:DNA mismatch repair endonuclease MutH [Lujinxingia litoralis]|uniref:DNA mismatch repair endonuclease MutH n=1 Tax=Lujinxingia litoralis TaxID=2211119 RepID=UPI0018F38C3C|nr:DNA mismatch repair endonuclease MutH [Lujinxingia litoralis]
MNTSTPQTLSDLLKRARAIAGLTLGELASGLGEQPPATLRRDKGWVGRMLEQALGADASTAQAPDFAALGIELKTLPLTPEGRPLESTFVTCVELADPDAISWETSHARQKLARVLFIPILTHRRTPPGERLIGQPLLWTPSPDEEARLRNDWERHMRTIRQGYAHAITAEDGDVLQIRPKGARASSRVWGQGPSGELELIQPRAYYLRPSFTAEIIARSFALSTAS